MTGKVDTANGRLQQKTDWRYGNTRMSKSNDIP